MSKYTHDFDFIASIESDELDLQNVDVKELRAAMLRRLTLISDDELREAFTTVLTINNETGEQL